MTINRVKPSGWALNEKLTSAQMNAVDTNTSYALDKRSGQTDTLSSVVTVASTGEIKFSSGAESTFESGSLITFNSGSNIEIDGYCTYGSTSQTTHLIGSLTTFNVLSFVNFLGVRQYNGSGSHESTDSDQYKSGSLVTHLSGSTDTYNSGSLINFNGNMSYLGHSIYGNGSVVDFNSGSIVNYNSSSLVNYNSGFIGSHASGSVDIFATGSLISHTTGSYDHYFSGSGMRNDGYGEFADLRLLGGSTITYDSPITYTRSFIPCVDQNWYMAGHPDFVFKTSVVGGKAWIDLGGIGVPNGATITEMRAYYLPAGGVHANLPGLLPRISLVTRQIGFTSIGVLSTKVDSFANVGAYEGIGHQIVKNMGAGTTLDFDVSDYWVVFEGEDGSDAEIGFELKYMTVVFTAPGMNNY